MAPRKKSTAAAESTSAKEVKSTEVTEEKSEAKAAEAKTTAKKAAEKNTAAEKASEKKKAEPKPVPKAIGTKKDTTKAIETKAGVLVEEKPAKEEKKPAAKKTTEKKSAEKKTATKKSSAKAEVKTEMFLQFDGKEFTEKEIFQKVKEVWTKVLKNKVGDMKEVKIYLKPEESAAYYVVNDDTSGKIEL